MVPQPVLVAGRHGCLWVHAFQATWRRAFYLSVFILERSGRGSAPATYTPTTKTWYLSARCYNSIYFPASGSCWTRTRRAHTRARAALGTSLRDSDPGHIFRILKANKTSGSDTTLRFSYARRTAASIVCCTFCRTSGRISRDDEGLTNLGRHA